MYRLILLSTRTLCTWTYSPIASIYSACDVQEDTALHSLQMLCLGGDHMPLQMAHAWSSMLPELHLLNVYGVTECTAYQTAHRCTPTDSCMLVSPICTFNDETVLQICYSAIIAERQYLKHRYLSAISEAPISEAPISEHLYLSAISEHQYLSTNI